MSLTGAVKERGDVERARAIKILNILLDSIQDNVTVSGQSPRLDGQRFFLQGISRDAVKDEFPLSIDFYDDASKHTGEELLFLDREVLGAVFDKLMALDWSSVDSENMPAVIRRGRTVIYTTFAAFIAKTASDKKYSALYLDHVEDIIQFSLNPNIGPPCYTPMFAVLDNNKACLTSQRKASVLQCIIQGCHSLIDIHKAHPECRPQLAGKLSSMYSFFLKWDVQDQMNLFSAGQRLRAYLYQNDIIVEEGGQEEISGNIFIYRPTVLKDMQALLEGSIHTDVDTDHPNSFMEGYILHGVLGQDRIYITGKDIKFPQHFLGLAGLDKSMVAGFEGWKAVLLRDYKQSPWLCLKPSLFPTVIARLDLLREGAPEELKKFILGCDMQELGNIYKTVLSVPIPAQSYKQHAWRENREFLILLFKESLVMGICTEEVQNVVSNEKMAAREILSIMYEAIKEIDKNDPMLSQLRLALEKSGPAKVTPAKGKSDEQSSPVIWIGVGIAIVAVLVSWCVYSSCSPFKVLGTSNSGPSLAFGPSSLIS